MKYKYSCICTLIALDSEERKDYPITVESKYPIPLPTLRKKFAQAVPSEVEWGGKYEIHSIKEELLC